jgi:cytochrome c-type biogenesis protein CcmH/NrfF
MNTIIWIFPIGVLCCVGKIIIGVQKRKKNGMESMPEASGSNND